MFLWFRYVFFVNELVLKSHHSFNSCCLLQICIQSHKPSCGRDEIYNRWHWKWNAGHHWWRRAPVDREWHEHQPTKDEGDADRFNYHQASSATPHRQWCSGRTSCGFQDPWSLCVKWSKVDAPRWHDLLEGLFQDAFLEAAETCRRSNPGLAVFLHDCDPPGHGIRLPSVAFQPHFGTIERSRSPAEASIAHNLRRCWLSVCDHYCRCQQSECAARRTNLQVL